jgi:serine/threonine protein phosphatase 1
MLYAIGDVHGRYDLITKLYSKIIEHIDDTDDPSGAQIIFLGDMIDRGPQSKEVLDFLMSRQDTDHTKHVFLLGNHEELMVQSHKGDRNAHRIWMGNGGQKTLKSFDITIPYYISEMQRTLAPYVEWMESLPFYYEYGDYVFSHSGYFRWDFQVSLDYQKEHLIWGRVSKGYYKGYSKCVVHGHDATFGDPFVESNRVNIDTGGWYHDMNYLMAVVLPHGPCDTSILSYLRAEL